MANDIVWTCIRDIRPGMKNLNVLFIVLDIGKPTQTKDGHQVRSVKISDKTGCVNMSVWDAMGDLMHPGDICRVTKGYGSVWKGSLTLYAGKGGEMEKVGEFCMLFSESPNMSDPQADFLQKPTDTDSAKNAFNNFTTTTNASVTTPATPISSSSSSSYFTSGNEASSLTTDPRKNYRRNGAVL